MDGLTVTIPYSRLERLLDIETRAEVLKQEIVSSKYSVDREQAARILGFSFPVEWKSNE